AVGLVRLLPDVGRLEPLRGDDLVLSPLVHALSSVLPIRPRLRGQRAPQRALRKARRMRSDLVAEFDTPERLVRAIADLRHRGYRELDAFSPYPLKAVEEALALKRSPINWLVLPVWLVTAAGAYTIQWWC